MMGITANPKIMNANPLMTFTIINKFLFFFTFLRNLGIDTLNIALNTFMAARIKPNNTIGMLTAVRYG
ncbi:unnamed protein product [marine sediment metagenome]|uniref:Uncharacterized protein n=1 Tax=marine sediment metagenome TaxID=412755 RepID=X0UZM5_9ZZZZ